MPIWRASSPSSSSATSGRRSENRRSGIRDWDDRRRRQRPHHRGCRPRPGVHGAAETVAAGQHGTVRQWAYVARVRRVAERRDCRVPVHAGWPRRQDQPRHPAVAGNPRPAHQRFRNDRADRAETRRGPHPHPGSGTAGSRPIEAAARTDGATAVPPAVRRAARGAGAAAAARLRGRQHEGQPRAEDVGADGERRDGGGRGPDRRAADFRQPEQRTGRQLPIQPEGRAAVRPPDSAKTSESPSPSCSTTRW